MCQLFIQSLLSTWVFIQQKKKEKVNCTSKYNWLSVCVAIIVSANFVAACAVVVINQLACVLYVREREKSKWKIGGKVNEGENN